MTDRYAVAGNPVAHSKSPFIHAQFARQTAQDLDYCRLLVPLGGFDDLAREFFATGGSGLNVTLPFKEDAFRFADRLTARATRAGAVNTLAREPQGGVLGDNTDGAGLVCDLEYNLGWRLAGARVLLLGAGGAARGALGPLLDAGPRELRIANRTATRAVRLAATAGAGSPVQGGGFDEVSGVFDLVINATSAGIGGAVPPLERAWIGPHTRCYDMFYGDAPTPFQRWAAAAGARSADGLGMLVEQAAESFLLWRGVRPDTQAVIARLRDGYRIREARDEDMPRVAELFREYQAWLGADLCFQGFEQELASLPGAYAPPRGALLLADSGGETFACVAMRPLAEEGVCEMKRLYVPESWRGAGLGRALAKRVIEAARSAGYLRMRLDTLQRLREANALYRSLGFERCEPYYENPLEEVVFWELDLRPAGMPASGERALRRFVAGARCPACGCIDKLFLLERADERICECVACGHRETLSRDAAAGSGADGEQPLRIVDPRPD